MKNIFFLLLTSLYSFVFSQSENDIILIRTKVEKINTDSKNYQTAILKSDQGLSTEGNEITVYTEQLNEIKLIKEIYLGEMGKTVITSYIEENHPIFIFKEYYTYKFPITFKEFSSSDFTKSEERFYLKNDRIIKWMKDKKTLKTYPKNGASIESNMMEHVASLISQFEKENKE
jgi:hypothetical protein